MLITIWCFLFRIWKAKKWLKNFALKLYLNHRTAIPNHPDVCHSHGQLMDKHCLLDTQTITLEFGKCLSVLVNVTTIYFDIIYLQFLLYLMFDKFVLFFKLLILSLIYILFKLTMYVRPDICITTFVASDMCMPCYYYNTCLQMVITSVPYFLLFSMVLDLHSISFNLKKISLMLARVLNLWIYSNQINIILSTWLNIMKINT